MNEARNRPETIKTFIETIDDLAIKCVALLLVTSGLRKNEVLGLSKDDITEGTDVLFPVATTERPSILEFRSIILKLTRV